MSEKINRVLLFWEISSMFQGCTDVLSDVDGFVTIMQVPDRFWFDPDSPFPGSRQSSPWPFVR
jgi:hypothetical protein